MDIVSVALSSRDSEIPVTARASDVKLKLSYRDPEMHPSAGARDVKSKPHKLVEIEGSPVHKLTLQDWNAQLSDSFNSLDRKLSSRNFCTSQLYQILGLFFVFHGLILTAVAQANAIKCRNTWLIFTLSAMVSVAAIVGCFQKLKEVVEAERNYLKEKVFCAALFQSIQQLKLKGKDFDVVSGQPNFQGFITGWDRFRTLCKNGIVFIFLLAFSGVNLAAINLIVCDPQRNT